MQDAVRQGQVGRRDGPKIADDVGVQEGDLVGRLGQLPGDCDAAWSRTRLYRGRLLGLGWSRTESEDKCGQNAGEVRLHGFRLRRLGESILMR